MPVSMRYRIKHIAEYAALRFLAAVFNAMPYRCALAFGAGIGRVLFHAIRFRRQETLRRIHAVFGAGLPRRRALEIARISLRNLILNAIEMMRAARIDRAWVDAHIPDFASGADEVRRIIESHGGAIIAVPHTGNWDLAGWACCHYGIPVVSIGGRQKNPLVNRWINRQRESAMIMLDRGAAGTPRRILRLLRQRHALAILPDVRMYEPDLSIDFLGGTANLGRGMAQFAVTARIPIIPAAFFRRGLAAHGYRRFDTILPDTTLSKEQNIEMMTRKVMGHIDDFIRREPEQWFWYNKRWVLTPVKRVSQKKSSTASLPATGRHAAVTIHD
jgi:Kdo2-lipid IVA lauroyltransferase/acyltransferase